MSTQDDKKKREAMSIVTEIESLIARKFEGYKKLSYNTNTKGYDYEYAVYKILEEYLNPRFNFYLRPHLLDVDMSYLEILSKKGENEVDVAATFKSTIPNSILKTDKTSFVAYDSVAFIVEVKAVLNSQSLTNDLNKFEKIAKLPIDSKRFPIVTQSQFAIEDRPLRILVYDTASIKQETMESVLTNNDFWDIIFVVNEKVTIINKLNIPFAKFLEEEIKKVSNASKITYWFDVPFITILLMILNSTPDPQRVDIIRYFIKLASIAFSKKSK